MKKYAIAAALLLVLCGASAPPASAEEPTLARHAIDQAVVIGLYKVVLCREPDADGLTNWITALDYGAPLVNVIEGFTRSHEAAYSSCPNAK